VKAQITQSTHPIGWGVPPYGASSKGPLRGTAAASTMLRFGG
jgi:hypothetical protein